MRSTSSATGAVGVALDQAALAGPDHAGVRHYGEVDREHDRAGGRGESDPPYAARRDQPAAFDRREPLYDRRALQPELSRWYLHACAEQGGGGRAQHRGELAQRGRAGPGRVPLQVFQVPQAHPGPGGHLLPAQMQLLAPPLHSLAQVAGVGWRRPPMLVRLLGVGNRHRDSDAQPVVGRRRLTSSCLSAMSRRPSGTVRSAYRQPEQAEAGVGSGLEPAAAGRWSITGSVETLTDHGPFAR
jgi:hypothetical protein